MLIRAERVSKTFETRKGRPVQALAGIDLDVRENEFVTVVGRSGCGKSTLLRILAGLIPASSGSVTIGGGAVTAPRRDVGFVFQRPALLPWRTVLENVVLPIELAGGDLKRGRREALELLDLVGLEGFEHRHAWELSGGMQQRVATCRSLVSNPALLLMDEPFAALDALTREEMSLELQRIWSERRTTIVFVTHSIQEAVVLSDRVIVLTPRPGRIAREVVVDTPRPRDFASVERDPVVQRATDEVRALLFAREAA
jgi:NitT/TauT family transport system ATP-binding protein